MAITLNDIVARLGGELSGDGSQLIHAIAPLEGAGPGTAAFLSNPKYRKQLAATGASVVILAPEVAADCPVASIATAQPYLYFARLSQWLNPPVRPPFGVDPRARVESPVPATASVGAGAWIGPDVVLGENVVVGANCAIGAGVVLGADTVLCPGVSIYAGCRLGQRVLVHSGAVVGSDGFGFARESDGRWVKIPQVGRVLICDDVEIGANTTIDRGALGDTVIEEGVKLDNQIQVGHNVHIGAHAALAGCVGIAGSARIGRRCTIGGGAVILGHLEIADDVHVSAGTLVSKSIGKQGSYTGTVPFMSHNDWLRNFSRLRHLDAMADKIRALENRIAELEKKS